jgi:hypothetical protein
MGIDNILKRVHLLLMKIINKIILIINSLNNNILTKIFNNKKIISNNMKIMIKKI